jgi:hypothetical protein
MTGRVRAGECAETMAAIIRDEPELAERGAALAGPAR